MAFYEPFQRYEQKYQKMRHVSDRDLDHVVKKVNGPR